MTEPVEDDVALRVGVGDAELVGVPGEFDGLMFGVLVLVLEEVPLGVKVEEAELVGDTVVEDVLVGVTAPVGEPLGVEKLALRDAVAFPRTRATVDVSTVRILDTKYPSA